MFCSYHRQFLQGKSEFWEPKQQQFSSWGIKTWNKWGGAFYQLSQIHVCKNAIYQLNCKRNMQWMSCLQEVAVGFGFNFWFVGVQWLINCSYSCLRYKCFNQIRCKITFWLKLFRKNPNSQKEMSTTTSYWRSVLNKILFNISLQDGFYGM